MSQTISHPRLTSALFRLTAGIAGLLFLLVLLAPWLATDAPHPEGWPLILVLFSRDVVVRRTSVGAGLGLLVTAFVFFRHPPDPFRALRSPGKGA